jgi:outer membrane protein OmpA-like peptidoglycan-associated protein
VGPQGAIGNTGSQGPMLGHDEWNSYRDYTFNAGSNEIISNDSAKAREIAYFMSQNPNARIGLDGADRNRVEVVRQALLRAGVPANRIDNGAFGDAELRQGDRVAVLLGN